MKAKTYKIEFSLTEKEIEFFYTWVYSAKRTIPDVSITSGISKIERAMKKMPVVKKSQKIKETIKTYDSFMKEGGGMKDLSSYAKKAEKKIDKIINK